MSNQLKRNPLRIKRGMSASMFSSQFSLPRVTISNTNSRATRPRSFDYRRVSNGLVAHSSLCTEDLKFFVVLHHVDLAEQRVDLFDVSKVNSKLEGSLLILLTRKKKFQGCIDDHN